MAPRSTSCWAAPKEIPEGSEVVAYCRGPFCVYADEAVRLLAKKGRTAVRLEDGFPEWAAERLPVERADAWDACRCARPDQVAGRLTRG